MTDNVPSDRVRAYAEVVLPFFGDGIEGSRESQAERIARACAEVEAQRLAVAAREQAALRALLTDSLESLERIGCQFWACEGPTLASEDMVTCHVCALIARLHAALPDPEPTEEQATIARVEALRDEWIDPAGRGPVLTKRDCAALLTAALRGPAATEES